MWTVWVMVFDDMFHRGNPFFWILWFNVIPMAMPRMITAIPRYVRRLVTSLPPLL